MKLVAYLADVDSLGAGKLRFTEEIDDEAYVQSPDEALKKVKQGFIKHFKWEPRTVDRFDKNIVVDTETATKREQLIIARRLFEKFPMRLPEIEKAYPEIAVPVRGWDERHLRWLVDRVDVKSNKKLADEFYRKFGIKKSMSAMRDMKLRFSGMKPYSKEEY